MIHKDTIGERKERKTMKEKYQAMNMEVIIFKTEDIIITSDGSICDEGEEI